MKLLLAAYTADGNRLGILREAREISVAIAVGGATGSFNYPVSEARGTAWLSSNIEIAVEVPELANQTVGGVALNRWGEVTGRMVLDEDSGELFTSLEDTFTTQDYFSYLADMPIFAGLGHQLSYPSDATPASVIANRVEEARARGADYDIEVVDHGGWASDNPAAGVTFEDNADLGSWCQALAQDGVALFWVGKALHVMPAARLRQDRSLHASLRPVDIAAAPVKRERVQYDSVRVVGDGGNEGFYPPVGPPPSIPGRVKVVQASGVTDAAVLEKTALEQFASWSKPRRQITATLNLGKAPKLAPLRDYFVGSLIGVPTRAGTTEKVQVAQITLTRQRGEDMGAAVVLDSIIPPPIERLIRVARATSRGATQLLGTGTIRT